MFFYKKKRIERKLKLTSNSHLIKNMTLLLAVLGKHHRQEQSEEIVQLQTQIQEHYQRQRRSQKIAEHQHRRYCHYFPCFAILTRDRKHRSSSTVSENAFVSSSKSLAE